MLLQNSREKNARDVNAKNIKMFHFLHADMTQNISLPVSVVTSIP